MGTDLLYEAPVVRPKDTLAVRFASLIPSSKLGRLSLLTGNPDFTRSSPKLPSCTQCDKHQINVPHDNVRLRCAHLPRNPELRYQRLFGS
jgi:hypothetical protein